MYKAAASSLFLLLLITVAWGIDRIAVDAPAGEAGANVGVSVGVLPNPYNTLAQQLQDKENDLTKREADLSKKEEGSNKQDKTLIYALIGGGVLLLLILLNFYFDYRRKRRKQDTPLEQ